MRDYVAGNRGNPPAVFIVSRNKATAYESVVLRPWCCETFDYISRPSATRRACRNCSHRKHANS